MATILVVEGEASVLTRLGSALDGGGHVTICVTSSDEALDRLERVAIDVALVSMRADSGDGRSLCEKLVTDRREIAVIALIADDNLDVAIEAIRAGAFDMLRMPVEPADLLSAVTRATRRCDLLRRLATIDRPQHVADDRVIGESAGMRRVRDVIERVAATESSILLEGASGTGKNLIARTVHERSSRRHAPFVSFRCGGSTEEQLDAELRGVLERAAGGTLFLDDVGELPLTVQPRLLRALKDKMIRPLGSVIELPLDVRVVTGTAADLPRAIAAGHFRSDLFFRLNGVAIKLPSLSARGADVLLLARHFLASIAQPTRSMAPAAEALLRAYDWPGNVRELRNCVHHAATIGRFQLIGPDDLPDVVRTFAQSVAEPPPEDRSHIATLDEVERRYVARVLAILSGNKSAAARMLGIDRKTLYRKMGYDIDGDDSGKP